MGPNISLWEFLGYLLIYAAALNLYWFIAVNVFKRMLPSHDGWEITKETFQLWREGKERFSVMLTDVFWYGLGYLIRLSYPLPGILLLVAIFFLCWRFPQVFFWCTALVFGLGSIPLFWNSTAFVFMPLSTKNLTGYRVDLIYYDMVFNLVAAIVMLGIAWISYILAANLDIKMGTTFSWPDDLTLNGVEADYLKQQLRSHYLNYNVPPELKPLLWLARIIGIILLAVIFLGDRIGHLFMKIVGKFYIYRLRQYLKNGNYDEIRFYYNINNDIAKFITLNPEQNESFKEIYQRSEFLSKAKESGINAIEIENLDTELDDITYVIDDDEIINNLIGGYFWVLSGYPKDSQDYKILCQAGDVIAAGQPFLRLRNGIEFKSPIFGKITWVPKYLRESPENEILKIKPFKGQKIPPNTSEIVFGDLIDFIEYVEGYLYEGNIFERLITRVLPGDDEQKKILKLRDRFKWVRSRRERYDDHRLREADLSFIVHSLRFKMFAVELSDGSRVPEEEYFTPGKIAELHHNLSDPSMENFAYYVPGLNWKQRGYLGYALHKEHYVSRKNSLFPKLRENEKVEVGDSIFNIPEYQIDVKSPLKGIIHSYPEEGGVFIIPTKGQELPDRPGMILYGDLIALIEEAEKRIKKKNNYTYNSPAKEYFSLKYGGNPFEELAYAKLIKIPLHA